MANKIIHKHSSEVINGKAKLPDITAVTYGELAVNFATGHETISTKNKDNKIVEFASKTYIDKQDSSLNAQINALNLKVDAIEHIYTTTLDGNLEMRDDVGGIGSGTTVSDLTGKTISSIIDDLLFPTISPTHTEPSISGFNLSNTTSPVEIGSSARTITSATLDRGKWSEFNNDLPYAGTATSTTYEIKINNQTYNNINSLSALTYTTVGNQIYKVTIAYNKGTEPKNNKGDTLTNYAAPASSVTLTRTINVTYPIFATTKLKEESNGGYYGEFQKTTLLSWSNNAITTGNIKVVKQEKTTDINRKQRFKVPRKITLVQTLNTLNNEWVTSTGDWSIVDANGSFEKINGVDVRYYTYYYNADSSIGEQTIKIKF